MHTILMMAFLVAVPGPGCFKQPAEPPKDSIAAFMAANRQGAAGQFGGVKERRFSRDEQVRASYRQRLRMTRDRCR